jgi:C_GCAxxG_C_C family probable redox protein
VTPELREQAKAQAMAGYLDPGPNHLNCAQAVLSSAVIAMEEDPALTNVANYFGGGIARMGQTCGAVTGAAIGLGLRDLGAAEGSTKNSGFDPLQQLMRDFEERFGAVTCKGLLGCDISTDKGFRQAKKTQALTRCPLFVEWTIDRLAEILGPAAPGA